jgi:hypothetical protein
MQVRGLLLCRARRADCAHRLPLGHVLAARHRDRSEVDERDRESVRRLDCQAQPVRRDRSREGDSPFPGRNDRSPGVPAEVDAAMLTRGVGVVPVVEGRQDGSGRRPGPGMRGWSESEDYEGGSNGRSQR